jgi:hypothetical protein
VHPGLHRPAVELGDGQQFDAVAELGGELDVHGGDFGDSLDVDIVEIDLHAESQGRENGQLVGRILSLDVQGRIGLGITLGLGLGQGGFRKPRPRR